MRLPNDTDGVGSFDCEQVALELIPNGQAWHEPTTGVAPPCGTCFHPSDTYRETLGGGRRCRHCSCRAHWPTYDKADTIFQSLIHQAKERRARDRERKRRKK